MAKLNQADLRILKNPPKPDTWDCGRKLTATEIVDGKPTSTEWICQGRMSGKMTACWLCRAPRPSKPKLVWPTYVAACKKAGVEPNSRPWTPAPIIEAPIRPQKPRRKKGQ